MKEKYLKYKKLSRSLLGLGTTLSLLGIFGLFSGFDALIFSIIVLILGIVNLIIYLLLKKKTQNIVSYCYKKCIICDKDIVNEIKIKYFINDKEITEEDFNNYGNNKTKMVINYYKCYDCKLCLTVIKTYLINNNKEKELNDKINLDFEYEGDY